VAAAAAASTPTKTLAQYCNDYKAGDYGSAYDLLSSNLQSQFTRQQYITAEQQAANQVGGVTNCTVANVIENDPSATGIVTFTAGNGKTASETDKLVDQNGTWKIDNISTNG
jgi:hypothetical protein